MTRKMVEEKRCQEILPDTFSDSDVTLEEARLTIIQAYIFIGELARFCTENDQQPSAGDRLEAPPKE